MYGYIALEYSIPRMGKRVDVVIIDGLVFIIECKIGDSYYSSSAILQVTDYALDLNDFHAASINILIVPMVLCSNASNYEFNKEYIKTGISFVQKCNKDTLNIIIKQSLKYFKPCKIDPLIWLNSSYKPTPTIIEAAKMLFSKHIVENISHSDASTYNLNITANAINKIINNSKINGNKSICFITGVPGAGKTLAGLNLAVERQNIDFDEHAVFLSGNGPLVNVLQEALARDQQEREGVTKSEAKRKAKEFIQLIHHFRDDALSNSQPPIEKVVIFDEAQRAWTSDMLEKFMHQKKGVTGFNISEPEFLISVMNRHKSWATIICLIGGGQEINTGEAGLIEWFDAIKNKFRNWDIYISNNIVDSEYIQNKSLGVLLDGLKYNIIPELHLGVSLRSYRSENVSNFIKIMLDFNVQDAKKII